MGTWDGGGQLCCGDGVSTYNRYSVIIDVCILVEFVLEFCVLNDGLNAARVEGYEEEREISHGD